MDPVTGPIAAGANCTMTVQLAPLASGAPFMHVPPGTTPNAAPFVSTAKFPEGTPPVFVTVKVSVLGAFASTTPNGVGAVENCNLASLSPMPFNGVGEKLTPWHSQRAASRSESASAERNHEAIRTKARREVRCGLGARDPS